MTSLLFRRFTATVMVVTFLASFIAIVLLLLLVSAFGVVLNALMNDKSYIENFDPTPHEVSDENYWREYLG